VRLSEPVSEEPDSRRGEAALERGLEAGYRYAESHREDRGLLKTLARARSAPEVTASLDDADAAGEVGDPHQFWSGFAHGVAKFLVEDARVLE
jgi:hypothetical protein